MKRKRFTEEQIIGILKEAEAGAKSTDLCRRHAILIATDPIGGLNSVFERRIGIKSDIRVDVGRDSKFHVELRMRWN